MTDRSSASRLAAWRNPRRPVLILLLVGLATPVTAQDSASEVDVVAGVGVYTNPYNSVEAPDASVAATLEVRPIFRQITETDSFELQGLVQLRQFVKRFGLEDSYGISGRMVSRQSDRLTVRADGNFAYNESGFNNDLRSSVPFGSGSPVPPVSPLPGTGAPFDDITILGQRSRITSIGSKLGVDYRITDRSIVSADVSGRALRFKANEFGDYDYLSEELRYSQILTERTTVGAIVQFGQIDYRSGRVGDANTISGLLSVDHRLDERLKASVSAGIAVTKIRQQLGLPDAKLESFTLRGQICREGERTNVCLNLQRSPQPSADGNVRTSQSIGLDYWQRISPRERFSLSANYANVARGRLNVPNVSAVNFVSASARYENDIRKNTAAFASVNFSKIDQSGISRRANFGAMLGVRFKFGASR